MAVSSWVMVAAWEGGQYGKKRGAAQVSRTTDVSGVEEERGDSFYTFWKMGFEPVIKHGSKDRVIPALVFDEGGGSNCVDIISFLQRPVYTLTHKPNSTSVIY